MGGKSQTSTSQQTTTPTNQAGVNNIASQIGQILQTPYTPYGGQLTAPVNQQQTAGINTINQAGSNTQNLINQAAGMTQSASNPLTQQQIAQYNNPYTQQVVQATENQFNEQNAEQQNSLKGSAAAAGALGGDRQAVAQSQLAAQQQTSEAPVIANLEQSGYNQALATAAQQFQQNPLAAAGQLGNLGLAGQTAGLQEGQAQIGAGTLQQQTQQAQDTAQYQQYLQQMGYPFQIAQLLGSLDLPAVLAEGQNSSGSQTTPGPSLLSQLLGVAGLGIGLAKAQGGVVREGFAQGGSPFQITGLPYSGGPSYVPTGGGGATAHLSPASLQYAKPLQQPSVDQLMKAGQGITGLGSGLKNIGNKVSGFFNDPSYGGGSALAGDEWGGSAAQPLEGLDPSDYEQSRGGAVRGFAGGGSPYMTGLPYSDGDSGYMPSGQIGTTAALQPVNLQYGNSQSSGSGGGGLLGGFQEGKSLAGLGSGIKNISSKIGSGLDSMFGDDSGAVSGLAGGGFIEAVNTIHDTIHRARRRARRASGGMVSPFDIPRYADGGSDDSDDDGGRGGAVDLPAGVTTGSGTNPDAGPVTPDTPLYSPFMNVPDQPSPEAFNPNQGTPDPTVFSGGAKPLPFAAASAAGNPNLAAQNEAQGIAASPFDRGTAPNSVAAASAPAAANNLPASVSTGAPGAAAPPVPGLPAAGSSPMTAPPAAPPVQPTPPANAAATPPQPQPAANAPLDPNSTVQPDIGDTAVDTGPVQGPVTADVRRSQPQSRLPAVQSDFMNFFAPLVGKTGAAGMLGSVIGEVGQGLSPTQYGDHGSSYTVFQLHDDPAKDVHNQRDFRSWARQNGLNPDDRLTQYRYIQSYLQNHPELADHIRNAKTAGDAAEIWTREFERPADIDRQVAIRRRYAENANSDFLGNPRNPMTLASTPTGGGGGGGGGSGGGGGDGGTGTGASPFGIGSGEGGFSNSVIGHALGLGDPNAESHGLFGLSDRQSNFLMRLGAGMLASTSPFPGVALGQGALAALGGADRDKEIELRGQQLAAAAGASAAKTNAASAIPGAVKVGQLSAGTYLDNQGHVHPLPDEIETQRQFAAAKRDVERPQPISEDGAPLSGQAYIEGLNKMDAGRAKLAKAVGDYAMSVNEATGRSASREALMKDVLSYNPGYNANLYKGQGSTIMAFSSGAKADTVRSLNVLIGHLGTLDEATDALANGNSTLLNRLKQNWLEATGDPGPTNYDAVATIVSDELTKAVVPRGAEGDRDRAIALLRRDHSPQAIRGVIQFFKKMMASQVDGLRQEYEAGTQMHDFDKFLLPETQEALAGLGRDGRQPAAAAPADGAPAGGAPAAPAASSRPSGVPANAVPRQFKGRTVWFDPDTRKPYPGQ